MTHDEMWQAAKRHINRGGEVLVTVRPEVGRPMPDAKVRCVLLHLDAATGRLHARLIPSGRPWWVYEEFVVSVEEA